MSRKLSTSTSANAAGSPRTGEPALLAVGKLRHPHGVHGEILMEIYTDFPERLQPDTVLYLDDGQGELILTRTRAHHDGLLLTLQGYSTPEAVGELRNRVLYVRADDRPPLQDGEYYQHQLLGLSVLTEAGETVGQVTEILETGASDVLVVRPEAGPEVLIPVGDDFVRAIDLNQQQITVCLIPGMRGEEP